MCDCSTHPDDKNCVVGTAKLNRIFSLETMGYLVSPRDYVVNNKLGKKCSSRATIRSSRTAKDWFQTWKGYIDRQRNIVSSWTLRMVVKCGRLRLRGLASDGIFVHNNYLRSWQPYYFFSKGLSWKWFLNSTESLLFWTLSGFLPIKHLLVWSSHLITLNPINQQRACGDK